VTTNDELRQCWNQRYAEPHFTQQSARVLSENLHLLPAHGKALDLACGLGANAVLLGQRGLETWAWDISPVAIARLDEAAQQANLTVHTEVRNVIVQPPEPDSFDVIVVSRFLERSLAPSLQAALRPAGVLFYQTFTKLRVTAEGGPRNPHFLLADNELLHLFAGLKVRVYREEGLLGELGVGFRNEAMLIAQKEAK
jgi:SAM-dependent methyltransferase